MKTKKPAPAPANNDDESIIREIEDAVKHDQYVKFMKKHAPLVALVFVLFVAVLIGGKMWKDARVETAKAAGEKIYLALNSAGYDSNALNTSKASSDINQVSELTKARLLADSGKAAEAESLYEKIAANENYDDAFRELALLTRASMLMNSGVGNKQIKDEIEVVANNGKVFKYSAEELLAAYELQFGDKANAKKILDNLIADKNTPSGIMLRAKQITSNI